jgi:hypothetical protein
MFFDMRQGPGIPQTNDPMAPNYVMAMTGSGASVLCEVYETRTLDLYPRLPEFFHACELIFTADLPPNDRVTLVLGGDETGWRLPEHPITPFHFWFLEAGTPHLRFLPTGYKTYRAFTSEHPEDLQPRVVDLQISVRGSLPSLEPENTRPTPGILWGDIHGMAFNQRPLDDFYRYARQVARFDFAAAMLFSYNVCVEGIWDQVKCAAARWSEPGKFLALVGVEAGTMPDGSHRNAYFFDPQGVPPIFCEDRPPARERRLTRRFSSDTIFCETREQFYETVARYGGIVTGHFHTWEYDREILAEIWQKQVGSEGDEPRIFDLLNEDLRLGVVAGSDTHDSMPGNPHPEPYCPQPAGFMAVLADEVSAPAIQRAILQRRVYGTTGVRILLHFSAVRASMGGVLPAETPRHFQVSVEGTSPLARVALIRNGELLIQIVPEGHALETALEDPHPLPDQEQWYLIKVTQVDGHRAWSSPIWFFPQEMPT